MITFKVTITKIESNLVDRHDWQRLADTGGKDGGVQYGYVKNPEPKEELKTTTVLEQHVDTVDIPAVIKAINGIE